MARPPTQPNALGSGQQLRSSRRQYRVSDEPSPIACRTTDDLLSRLTPMTAVHMLQTPNHELKQCFDNAPFSEQELAMRTAMASRNIYEWLQELSGWPWPAASGSAGFEMPDSKSIKLDDAGASDTEYLGCLPAEHVTQYEKRVDGISHGLDELYIEDIKSHILHTHIIPLSKPGSPGLSSSTVAAPPSYNRMDDLTAFLAATVIQILPNLSKLCRLLKIWHIRLCVLRRIPVLLTGISEAEVALESAWNVLSSPVGATSETSPSHEGEDDLSRLEHTFTLVKRDLEEKITQSSCSLDFMLDRLEGLQDTLPETWLDRMEALERQYANWVASGEQRMRQGEWRRETSARVKTDLSAHLNQPVVKEEPNTVVLPVPITIDLPRDETQNISLSDTASEVAPKQTVRTDRDNTADEPTMQLQAQARLQPPVSSLGDYGQVPKPKRTPLAQVQNESMRKVGPIKDNRQSTVSKLRALFEHNTTSKSLSLVEDAEAVPKTPVTDEEIRLPPLIHPDRRGSTASELSTIIDGHSSLLVDASSDIPDVSASPPLPYWKRAESLNGKSASNDLVSISPPSSPPSRFSIGDHSASPVMRTLDEDLLPALPLESSFIEEDEDQSFTSVGTPRESNTSDDHLRQQISDILESIPAKIKLVRATAKVDLNPPPPELPAKKLKKTSRETIRRTSSSMSLASGTSSRAATPWLTLAPAYAKNPRPRRPRSRNDIQVYLLSRSTGEAPIKLFIRCVGEHGERVMVRVGGGWADLGEYLKEYAAHHGRRSAGPVKTAKIEVQDIPRENSHGGQLSPFSRPASALDMAPMTPLNVRKSRKSFGADEVSSPCVPRALPNTPAVPPTPDKFTPPSVDSNRSRSSSHVSWEEEESSFLGLAGPTGRKVEMSEENRAWVESVKEKVRLASGEARKMSEFGDMGKVGSTKRLFRKG